MVALVVVLWLAQSYRPRTFLGRGLIDHGLWMLVLLVSVCGTAGSLIPYYVGQRGTKAVFEHYPRLEGRPWQRLEAAFQRWGAFTLILSGIPGLGAALLVAAGAFAIKSGFFSCGPSWEKCCGTGWWHLSFFLACRLWRRRWLPVMLVCQRWAHQQVAKPGGLIYAPTRWTPPLDA